MPKCPRVTLFHLLLAEAAQGQRSSGGADFEKKSRTAGVAARLNRPLVRLGMGIGRTGWGVGRKVQI